MCAWLYVEFGALFFFIDDTPGNYFGPISVVAGRKSRFSPK
jgi:hypothetical protein